MEKMEMYKELHELKKDEEVKRFLALCNLLQRDDSVESMPIYKVGFSPAFLETAKQNSYDLYGELTATPLTDLFRVFPLAQLEELMAKEASFSKLKEIMAAGCAK